MNYVKFCSISGNASKFQMYLGKCPGFCGLCFKKSKVLKSGTWVPKAAGRAVAGLLEVMVVVLVCFGKRSGSKKFPKSSYLEAW